MKVGRRAAGAGLYDESNVLHPRRSRYCRSTGWVSAFAQEIARVTRDKVYEDSVFLIRQLGFAEPTAARRISYQDSLLFEAVH